MKTHRLTTNVMAVPSSDHQRIHSSLPRGKNNRPSAKIAGTKITADISSMSVSAMSITQKQGSSSYFPGGLAPSSDDRISQMPTAASTRNST